MGEPQDTARAQKQPDDCRRRRCCESGDGTRRGVGAGKGSFVEPALLAALAISAGHGYDLARAIEEMTQGEVVPDAGGLYRILRRLEEDGFVISEWQEGESGPQRRLYSITSDGRALLAHWLVHLEERRHALDVLTGVVRSASGPA
ncbi:MAG: PadR family transcriptional regulator [Actinomycetota bacterium]